MKFPSLGWNWDQGQPPLYIYCSYLWDINYKKYIYGMCDYFLSPLHTIMFGYSLYKISMGAMKGMKEIEKQYLGKYYT
jgi:hypothetical protein